MFSPEEQQIEICLLKSNLEEIENVLVTQRSAIPALDAENEQKYQETMAALRTARSLNTELERLKQESVRLTAKRTQLQRQCEDLDKALEKARGDRTELQNALVQENHEIELEIQRYENTLRGLADRFRQTPANFNEDEMRAELEMIMDIIKDLREEEQRRQNEVDRLKTELDSLQADIPDDILDILGKTELDEKLKSISLQCDSLRAKYNHLLKSRNNIV